MAINATNSGFTKELIPAGNYLARCYQMIHIGTITELFQGEQKVFNKVRIGWELPTELKVFNTEKGEQPCVISKEFTLSMHEKSNLRKVLASWRGKDFSEDQAKSFDITKLLGAACMLNLIHKPSKDGTKMYEEISSITPLPKGIVCPEQINKNILWDYDNPDYTVYNLLPDFIKQKINTSVEYKRLHAPMDTDVTHGAATDFDNSNPDDLPF